MYDKAADYYEKFADKYPGEDGKKCTEADNKKPAPARTPRSACRTRSSSASVSATRRRPSTTPSSSRRTTRKKYPRETSQVNYSLGSIYERQDDWAKVTEHYQSF